MRLSSLVFGAVLVSTSAGSEELVWTSVGKVKSVRYVSGDRIDFTTSVSNACSTDNDRFVIDPRIDDLTLFMSLLLSAMANEYEVRVVASECVKTDSGLAAEVKELMIVRP